MAVNHIKKKIGIIRRKTLYIVGAKLISLRKTSKSLNSVSCLTE